MELENFGRVEINCACGKTHSGYTKYIKFGEKAICFLVDICKRILSDGVVGVCYCEDTEIFGKRVCKLLQESGYMTEEICFCANTPPTQENAQDIVNAKESIRLFVGVGGGSLCEMLKFACHIRGCECVYAPTAPTTKSYLSEFSIFWQEGIPRKFVAKAPLGLVCDSEIFSTASNQLCASGYGELLASLLDIAEKKLYHIENQNLFCPKLVEMQEEILRDFFARYQTKPNIETIFHSIVELGVVEQLEKEDKIATTFILAGLLEEYNMQNAPYGINKLIFATIVCKLCVSFLKDGRGVINLPDDRVLSSYEISKLCNRENLDYVLNLSTNLCQSKNLFVLREFCDDIENIFAKALGEITRGLKYFRRMFADAGYWLSTYESVGSLLKICANGVALCDASSILGLMSAKGALNVFAEKIAKNQEESA
ncbi:MAG: iron-containing alcohol dehydrogenase [Clostridia bacterium]